MEILNKERYTGVNALNYAHLINNCLVLFELWYRKPPISEPKLANPCHAD